MLRSRAHRLALLTLTALVACDGDPATGPAVDEPLFSLTSEAEPTLLVPGFHFLPPTVAPPVPTFTGVFDPDLAPVLDLCALAGGDPQSPDACATPPVRTLTVDGDPPEFVRLDDDESAYVASWISTDGLTAGERYRAFVRVGGTILGYVDLIAVAKGPADVPAGLAGVRIGAAFVFRFRIEAGIVGSISIQPDAVTLLDADTPDQSAAFVVTVEDLHGVPLEGATVDLAVSDPALLAVDPESGSTDPAGQLEVTATTTGTVETATEVTLTATSQGQSATATVTIEPTPVESPIAQPDLYAVLAGETLSIAAPAGFLVNDYDLDGEALTATAILDNVDHGALTAFGDGSFSYTPDPGFTGSDAFVYRMRDASNNLSDPATVTVEVVEPTDLSPVAQADLYAVMEGKTLTVAAPGFLANDVDPNGEALTATAIQDNVDHGTLTAFGDGSFTYTPDPGFTGTDAFVYQMRDASNNLSEPVQVTLEVIPDPDQNPLGQADRYAVLQSTTRSVAAPGFLANDIDPDGEALTAVAILDNVDHGTLTAFGDGSFTYNPDPGFTGTDAFVYQMRDASNFLSDPVTVTLDVLPGTTTSPVAVEDLYLTFQATTLSVAAPGFLGNDLDPDGEALAAVAILDNVDHGSLVAFADGGFTYTPSPGFTGTDAFTYQMRDASNNLSDPVTVTLEVVEDPDEAPLGQPDEYLAYENQTLNVAAPGFLTNDIDPDGEALTAVAILDNVDHGSLVAFADGGFGYTPEPDFTGSDAFVYQMRDASNFMSDPVTVSIEVLADPNQAPVAFPDLYAAAQGKTLSIPPAGFLTNDVDPEGEALTAVALLDNVDHGTLIAFADGSFTYAPDGGFSGTDQFVYLMRDASSNLSGEQTVSVTVYEPAMAMLVQATDEQGRSSIKAPAGRTARLVGDARKPVHAAPDGPEAPRLRVEARPPVERRSAPDVEAAGDRAAPDGRVHRSDRLPVREAGAPHGAPEPEPRIAVPGRISELGSPRPLTGPAAEPRRRE